MTHNESVPFTAGTCSCDTPAVFTFTHIECPPSPSSWRPHNANALVMVPTCRQVSLPLYRITIQVCAPFCARVVMRAFSPFPLKAALLGPAAFGPFQLKAALRGPAAFSPFNSEPHFAALLTLDLKPRLPLCSAALPHLQPRRGVQCGAGLPHLQLALAIFQSLLYILHLRSVCGAFTSCPRRAESERG
jgi:hypothetical protein